MNWVNSHVENVLNKLPSGRIVSVDVFRGFAITGMILVNNPGSWSSIYAPLKHAHWNGWTPTDLIFPFFLFIVGLSISLSVSRLKQNQISRVRILRHSALRMLKLFALGWLLALFYYNFSDPSFSWIEQRFYKIRIMGVLQRIGVVYFVSVSIYLFLSIRNVFTISILLLLVYFILMQYTSYSDSDGTLYRGLWLQGNNFAAWFDQTILGTSHVYAQTTPFVSDPEGLLSTLPATSSCLSGILMGHLMGFNRAESMKETQNNLATRLTQLLIVGAVLTILGLILDSVVPINKSLWTPSYVLLTSGISCLVFSICYYLIDIKQCKAWSAPFIVFGLNSIAFFMFAGIVGRLLLIIRIADTSLKHWIYINIYQPLFGDYLGSLMFAICFLIVSYSVMYSLYRRSIFWKV